MGKVIFEKLGTTYSKQHYANSRSRLEQFLLDENTNLHWKYQKKNVLELLDISHGDNFLDIGCGSGKYEVVISKIAKVTALDISENALKNVQLLVERLGKPENVRTKLFERPLNSLFSNEKFNKVMMIDSSEHMPRNMFLEILEDIKGLLTRKGVLLIYTPNDCIYELLRLKAKTGHINLMTMNEIKKTLSQKGYQILKNSYGSSHHPVLRRLEKIPLSFLKRRLLIKACLKA